MTVRWKLSWTEPCNCHHDWRIFRTMREALNAIPGLAKPFTNIAGKTTRLVRYDFRLRKVAGPKGGPA